MNEGMRVGHTFDANKLPDLKQLVRRWTDNFGHRDSGELPPYVNDQDRGRVMGVVRGRFSEAGDDSAKRKGLCHVRGAIPKMEDCPLDLRQSMSHRREAMRRA